MRTGYVMAVLASRIAAANEPPRFQEVTMFIGEQKVEPATDVVSCSEGAPGIVQVKVPRDGSRIIVTAIRPGQTSLLFLRRRGAQETWLITVFARPPQAVLRDLDQVLQGLRGVRTRQVGSRIFVEGTVQSEQALQRLEIATKEFREQVVNLITVDPTRVQRRLNVKLDIVFVEFTKRDGMRFGMSWPSQVGASSNLAASFDLLQARAQSASYTLNASALVAVDLLSHWGWAKILKRSTLVTANGVKARYLAGGELYVPISGIGGGSLQKIPFGTDVSITPRFDEDTHRIDLEVEAEASDMTEQMSEDSPHGRSLANVKTTVHLEIGQTMMLSGIHAQSERGGERGLPLLRHLPILGYLFKVAMGDRAQTEGAVFITPSIIHELVDADRRRLEKLVRRYRVFQGEGDD